MMSIENKIRTLKVKFYSIIILYDIGVALFSATLYLYMEFAGYSLADINLYISIFWIVSFFAEIPSGALSDSFGRRNTTILSALIRAIGLFAISLSAKNHFMLMASAILTALGSSLYSGSMSSWVIDEIKKLDSNYDFTKLFSLSSICGTVFSLVAGYTGAQVIGVINLAYPTVISGVVLMLTAIITWRIIRNDRTTEKDMTLKQYFEIYSNILRDGVKFFKEKKVVFWMIITFVSTAFITTAPFNQWQLYFKRDSFGIISGYLFVCISLAGMLGAFLVSRVKVKNDLLFFIWCNIIVSLSILLSVFLENFYLSVMFFLIHVVVTTAAQVISFTHLNEFLQDKTRTTVISIYYACEAISVVFAMELNSILLRKFGIGYSWIILAIMGVILMLVFSSKVTRAEEYFERKRESSEIQ